MTVPATHVPAAATPATVHAAAATPVAPATTVALGVDAVGSLAYAGGRLFVSTGNEVRAYSTKGALVGTVQGQPGAAGLAASADGESLLTLGELDDELDRLDDRLDDQFDDQEVP